MNNGPTNSDLVPLADRLRFMRIYRVIAVAVVIGFTLFAPDVVAADASGIASGTALYVAISGVVETLWMVWRRRGLVLFGLILIIDALYLGWLVVDTGFLTSPFRGLILLQLIAVALLGSYRTGMKVAMWHSMLLMSVYHAHQEDWLAQPDVALPGTALEQLLSFVAVLWLIAIFTTSLSAVNERELRRRRYDLEALAGLAADLEEAQTPEEVAQGLATRASDTFQLEQVIVFSYRDDTLVRLASTGDVRVTLDDGGVLASRSGSIATDAVTTLETQLIAGLDEEMDADLLAWLAPDSNYLAVPLTADGRAIGVLLARHSLRPGSRVERRVVSMLERFASQTALALRGAWLLEQVQHLAATDGLTLIPNRRTFEKTLSAEIARAGEHRRVSLLMLDIDQFKLLNDVHGHQAGDKALREVAGVLQEHCREFDTASRYGGEEFAIVLPSCAREQATETAEAIRLAISHETSIPLTVSVGVSSFPSDAVDAESLVQAADAALYRAKGIGRNCVVAATALETA